MADTTTTFETTIRVATPHWSTPGDYITVSWTFEATGVDELVEKVLAKYEDAISFWIPSDTPGQVRFFEVKGS